MTALQNLSFAAPWALLLLLAAPVAVWWELKSARSRRWALARGALVALLSLAVAGPEFPDPASTLAVLIDRSASADSEAADHLAEIAAQDGVPALPFGTLKSTDLEEAIDSGSAVLPIGGRLVLASDGRSTHGDAVAAARRARARGVRVDTIALPGRAITDAAALALDAPATWRAGDPMRVTVHVAASAPISANLTVLRDGEIVAEVANLNVTADGQAVAVTVPVPRSTGALAQFQARVTAKGDGDPTNDVAYALTHVAGPPRVLVIGDGLAGVALGDHLAREGVPATVAAPWRAPSDPTEWAAWDLVALVDVPAAALTTEQLRGLGVHVRGGAGLLLTAGRQSFTLGGWGGTDLGDLSPLSLDPPDQGDRGLVTLILVLDQSASMAGQASHPSITKLDVAREAAALAVESLAPGDTVGVVAYSDEPNWTVPASVVGDGRSLTDTTDQLAGLQASGGTRILPALSMALDAAAASGNDVKHVLLLTDGQDAAPDLAAFQAAVGQASGMGVTLSAIALGPDADLGLLGRLAEIGHGRLHLAPDPGALPRLTLEESRLIAGRSERVGAFRPVAAGDNPLVAGLDLQLPPLTGYLALKPKGAAEVALETPAGDPLLTVWQMGLGQVVAWSSDTGEAWATSWTSDPAAASFWAALARRLARRPGTSDSGVSVTVDEGTATIRFDARDASGTPLDLARVSAVVTPTLVTVSAAVTVALRQSAPGTYEGRMPATPGVFPLAVVVDGDPEAGTPAVKLASGWIWDGPRENRDFKDGSGHLEAVASAGGGQVLVGLPGLGTAAASTVPPWLVLVAAAAVIWAADVANQLGVKIWRWRYRSRGPSPFRIGWGRR